MGRDRTNPVRRFFNFDIAANKSMCKIGDCQHGVPGDHAANLERHVQRHHKDEHERLLAEKAAPGKRSLPQCHQDFPAQKLRQVDLRDVLQPTTSRPVFLHMTDDTIMKGCVELVTKNGRPFRLVDDSGFRQIIDPVLSALGSKRAITAATVKDRVQQEARLKREEISLSLKDRMFSLKLDCASRLDRALLGINVQYSANGRIVIQPLAMKELYERHTAVHLRSEVVETLSRYNLSVSQVYSVTTDNGANMVKAVRLLSEIDDERHGSGSDEEIEYDDPKDENHTVQSLLENPEGMLPLHLEDSTLLEGMRCAAHTLQLAVSDALKSSGCGHIVSDCRALVKKLRAQTVMSLIRKFGLKKPVIDCPTRWMSTLHMLTSLLELRGFVEGLLSKEERCRWTDDMWAQVQILAASLTPAEQATKTLQMEQLTVGDFYGAWLRCCMDTDKVSSPLAKALVESMKIRQRQLLETDVFCAAVYMDPRYRLLLTVEQKYQARIHLTKTWKRIRALQGEKDSSPNSARSEPSEDPEDALEVLLKKKEVEAGAPSEKTSVLGPLDIVFLLEMLDKEPRLSMNTSVLKFWEDRKERCPELYTLAQVALAVPATQVSVERAFSSLKFILSVQRSRISPDVLDDVLLLRAAATM